MTPSELKPTNTMSSLSDYATLELSRAMVAEVTAPLRAELEASMKEIAILRLEPAEAQRTALKEATSHADIAASIMSTTQQQAEYHHIAAFIRSLIPKASSKETDWGPMQGKEQI